MYLITILFGLCTFALLHTPDTHARRELTDFNTNIDWITGEEFKALDLSTNTKPIAVLLTQPWCGACKRLKATMIENGERLVEVSKRYVMVTVDGKENEDMGDAYAPDGQYIPRIILAEPNGKIRTDLLSAKHNAKYKYFHSSADSVALSWMSMPQS
eukprot:jgi/Ulvmu1/2931/UM149_0010.1